MTLCLKWCAWCNLLLYLHWFCLSTCIIFYECSQCCCAMCINSCNKLNYGWIFLLPTSLSKPEKIFCKQLDPRQKPWVVVLFWVFYFKAQIIFLPVSLVNLIGHKLCPLHESPPLPEARFATGGIPRANWSQVRGQTKCNLKDSFDIKIKQFLHSPMVMNSG